MSDYRAASLSRTLNMIKYVNDCLTKLRRRPAQSHEAGRPSVTGEQLYQVLKLTYIDSLQLDRPEIMIRLGELFPGRRGEKGALTYRTYYRWLESATTLLGDLLWGGSSPEVNVVFDIFEGLSDMMSNRKGKECSHELLPVN